MVRPITWRNVNAPSANPASALGIAVGAFRGAQQGSTIFADQMGELVEREDEQLTNEAVNDAYRTGTIDPSTDRRVDSGALLDAISKKEEVESEDLLQEGYRYTNKINEFKSSDDYLETQKRLDEERVKAETEGNRLRALEIQQRQQLLAADNKRIAEAEAKQESVNEIDRGFASLEQGFIQREVESRLQPAIDQYMEDYEVNMDDPESVRAMEEFTRRTRMGLEDDGRAKAVSELPNVMLDLQQEYGSDVVNASEPGRRHNAFLTSIGAAQDANRADQVKARKTQQKNLQTARGSLDADNPTGLYAMEHDGTGWVPSPGNALDNKLNVGQMKSFLSTELQLSASDTDVNMAKKVAMELGYNRQAFLQLVKNDKVYTPFDEDLIFDDPPEVNWQQALRIAREEMGPDLKRAAKGFTFDDGSAVEYGKIRPNRLKGSTPPPKDEPKGGTGGSTTQTLEGIDVHPSRENDTELKDQILKLQDELDRDVFIQPTGNEVPLTAFFKKSKQSDLERLIEIIESQRNEIRGPSAGF